MRGRVVVVLLALVLIGVVATGWAMAVAYRSEPSGDQDLPARISVPAGTPAPSSAPRTPAPSSEVTASTPTSPRSPEVVPPPPAVDVAPGSSDDDDDDDGSEDSPDGDDDD